MVDGWPGPVGVKGPDAICKQEPPHCAPHCHPSGIFVLFRQRGVAALQRRSPPRTRSHEAVCLSSQSPQLKWESYHMGGGREGGGGVFLNSISVYCTCFTGFWTWEVTSKYSKAAKYLIWALIWVNFIGLACVFLPHFGCMSACNELYKWSYCHCVFLQMFIP